MKNILIIYLISFFVTAASVAGETKLYCQLKKTPEFKKIRINDYPSYFFKVSPDGKHIGYINIDGNKILDLETGDSHLLPGSVDPIFSPDGRFTVIPVYPYEKNGSLSFADKMKLTKEQRAQQRQLSFYGMNLSSQEAPKSLFIDENSNGTYQSVGNIAKDTYRIVTDEDGMLFRNYRWKNGSIKPAGQFYKPCGNIQNFPTDLPILSKDGKFISVFDADKKTTKIFSINQNGDCKMALDLGIATGKVSFNHSSDKITFHIDHFKEQTGQYFMNTSADSYKDVYIMNLKRGTQDKDGHETLSITNWAKVSNNMKPGDSSYYPDFDKTGDIFYLQDSNNNFEFIQVKTSDLEYYSYDQFPRKDTWKENTHTGCLEIQQGQELDFILGQLWGNVCHNMSSEFQPDSILMVKNLTSESCTKLVMKEWTELSKKRIREKLGSNYRTDFLDAMTIHDLLATCSEGNGKDITTKVIGEWKEKKEKSFEGVIAQKCFSCHSASMNFEKKVPIRVFYNEDGEIVKMDYHTKKFSLPAFVPQNIDLTLSERMMRAIGDRDSRYRMPRGGHLTENEINLFFQNLTLNELNSSDEEEATVYLPFANNIYSDDTIKEILLEYENELPSNLNILEKMLRKKSYQEEVLCRYKYEGCGDYIKKQLRIRERELKEEFDEKEREAYLLELKCEFGYDIDPDLCE